MTPTLALPVRPASSAGPRHPTLGRPIPPRVRFIEWVTVQALLLARVVMGAMGHAVELVVTVGPHGQVVGRVLRLVGVRPVAYLASRAVAHEGGVDQAVNQLPVVLTVPPQIHGVVALGGDERDQNAPRSHIPAAPVPHTFSQGPNVSVVGHLVSGEAVNRQSGNVHRGILAGG
mgnify:CR=1 FL=1